jgi:hypothetical protein
MISCKNIYRKKVVRGKKQRDKSSGFTSGVSRAQVNIERPGLASFIGC